GPAPWSYVAPGVVVAATAVAADLTRQASHARICALGIAATFLGATYWHLQDFTILVLAAWLFWRDSPPAWQRWWLLAIAVAGEFAWPLTPLPLLVATGAWFGFLVAPRKVSRAVT